MFEFGISGEIELMERDTPIWPGSRLLSKEEAESNKEMLREVLDQWTIASLADGWKIDGWGYGMKIQPNHDAGLGHKLVIKPGI